MFIIKTQRALIKAEVICGSCLMATRDGQPRWKNGKIKCGIKTSTQDDKYRCINGFEVIEIDDITTETEQEDFVCC